MSPIPRYNPYFPTPVVLMHSFCPILYCFISESLSYFLENGAVSRKGCESILPHARLVSNLVISTVYGKRFKWVNIQEKNEKESRHPTGILDEGKGSETSITYSSSHVFSINMTAAMLFCESCALVVVCFTCSEYTYKIQSLRGISCRKCNIVDSCDARV